MLWDRPPPLTEPEKNALVCGPTVRMMGTVGVAPFKDAQNYIPISLRHSGDVEEDIGEMWDNCLNNVLFILLI